MTTLAILDQKLQHARGSLAALLPEHAKVDKMIRAVTSSAARTPDLLKCDPTSVVLALAQSCALGLEPNTSLGLAYLIPFRDKKSGKTLCQFIPGYKGLIRLATQSGEVAKIEVAAVYHGEPFAVRLGTDPEIKHEPYLDPPPKLEFRGAYAVATMGNGAKVFEWMPKQEIDRLRGMSKAGDFGPWKDHYAEMAKKTAIRRLCKVLPLSDIKAEFALRSQAMAEAGELPSLGDIVETFGEDVSHAFEAVADEPKKPKGGDEL